MSSTSDISITGLTGGSAGRIVILHNVGSNVITLVPNSTDSTAGNRFLTFPALPINAGETAVLQYDATSSGWRFPSIPVTAPAGHIYGLTLSNNGSDANNDIDVATGEAASDSSTPYMMRFGTALTKQLDATFTAGDDQGCLDTGTKATDTVYHLFLIMTATDAVTDILCSTSVSSPTMPSGYSYKRRIGSVITDGSGNNLGFTQNGGVVIWDDPPRDMNNASIGSSSRTLGNATAPTGVCVTLQMTFYIANSGVALYVSNPDADDEAVDLTNGPFPQVFAGSNTSSGFVEVLSNTSAQFGVRASTGSSNTVRADTMGYFDDRGRGDVQCVS